MKKVWYAVIAVALAVAVVVVSVVCAHSISIYETEGSNCRVYVFFSSDIQYRPICPNCRRSGELYKVEIADGEAYSVVHSCDRCEITFDVYVKND